MESHFGKIHAKSAAFSLCAPSPLTIGVDTKIEKRAAFRPSPKVKKTKENEAEYLAQGPGIGDRLDRLHFKKRNIS